MTHEHLIADVCGACDGAGRIGIETGRDRETGAPTGYWHWCEVCDGSGIELVPAELVEEEDLAEIPNE